MLLFAISPSFLFAQDIIIKNDKSELKAKVVEITSDFIKYHDWDNLTGPIYNIAKSQVFMINYQNGKREFITNSSTESTKVPTTVNNVSNTESVNDSPYTFMPKEKNKPKGYATFPDRITYVGVALNNIGKTTIPTIVTMTDIFVAPNIALTTGVTLMYDNSKVETVIGTFSSKVVSIGALVGGAYYLNQALKLDKTKGALYIGAAVAYTYTAVSSDALDEMVTSGDFGGFGRVGGRLNFTKGFGAFAEVQVGKGDPGIIGGLTFSIIK
ncbi:hypothetical protein VB264_06725 [Arcicella aquatica]|uniref:Outer membrane protein beta-barrel domain-containing protein n=1 Tax=Arcicella aquatica TaxID=217141 RepID=A0ABU5QKA6_9BACT|nr:hypothetical protein [Arcicella aquatica]MEA5257468.1 hypothetical protein [Arcicella aquatica]